MGFDGFDTVEFVVDIEESFGLKIDDKTAEKLRTVEDVHKYLLDNLDTAQLNNYCNSQKAFYLLRRSLINDFGFKRKDIIPSKSTEELFPLADRRQKWQKLSESVSLKLPHLLIPPTFWAIDALIAGLLILTVFGTALIFSSRSIGFLTLPVIFGWLLISTIIAFTKYSTVIPFSCKTIGGLSKTIASYNSSNFSSGKYTKKELWNILCNLISSQHEQELKDIKPETDLVYDL